MGMGEEMGKAGTECRTGWGRPRERKAEKEGSAKQGV